MNFNRNLGSTELEFEINFDDEDKILSDKDDDITSDENDLRKLCNSKSSKKVKNRKDGQRVKYDKEKVRIRNEKASRFKYRSKERSAKYWEKNGEDFDHKEVDEYVWFENERELAEEYRRDYEECKRLYREGENPCDVLFWAGLL